MRITFVVNTTGVTGGIRVVFEYANRLADRGHEVLILHPLDLDGRTWPHPAAWRAAAKRVKRLLIPYVRWFPLRVPVRHIPQLRDRWVPDADVIVATANETADWLARLSPAKGKQYYFIQGYETWTRDREQVERTWRLPLKKIVISRELLERAAALGVRDQVVACIGNGVDLERFTVGERDYQQPPRLLMLVHALPLKGTADGLAAISQLWETDPQVPVTLFGAYPVSAVPGLGTFRTEAERQGRQVQFVYRPTGDRLRDLYASHDLFLSPSRVEGWGLPPMEAMACGCAVVATAVGGVPEYTRDGETALTVPPEQPAALAAALRELVRSPERLQDIARAGQQDIRRFSWEAATVAFEEAVREQG